MFYLLLLTIIISILSHLILWNKLNQTRREMSGLPIGTPFPKSHKCSTLHSRHVVIVVSTTCIVCQRLFKSLSNTTDTSHLTLAFVDTPDRVEKFVTQHPYLKHINVVTHYKREDLFIKSTPLAFILNQKEIIIDKKSIVSLKELET